MIQQLRARLDRWIEERIVAWRLGVDVDWLRDRRRRAEVWCEEIATRPDIEGLSIAEMRERLKTGQAVLADVFNLAQDGNRYNLARPAVLELLGAGDETEAFVELKRRNRYLDGLAQALHGWEYGTLLDSVRDRAT